MSDRDKHRALRLAAELAEAQRKLEDVHVVMRILPIEYVDALASVWHVAHNGLKQPEDVDGDGLRSFANVFVTVSNLIATEAADVETA